MYNASLEKAINIIFKIDINITIFSQICLVNLAKNC